MHLDQLNHPRDEPPGRRKSVRRAVRRHLGARTGFVICDGLEIVGAAEEGSQFDVKVRRVLRQPRQLALHTAMRLHKLAGRFNDQRLCGVQTCKVGFTACLVGLPIEHAIRLRKTFAGLVEKSGGLGLHKSMPSARTPSISGVRSL
jgi:hypothetical protein